MPVLKVALHGKRFYKSHVHTTQGNLKTQSSSVILDFCLSKNRAGKYTNVNVFEKLCFQNVFRLHRNAKPVFSNSSGLKSVLKKIRVRGGLVWTVVLTVEIKLQWKVTKTLLDWSRAIPH